MAGKVRFSAKERFMEHVWPEPNSGCWIWAASTGPKGYGQFYIDGKMLRAHRAGYSLYRGDIPSGMNVCHKCDNKLCVNPEHMFVGTQKENLHDMRHKGRNKRKLSDSEVVEIRTSRLKGVELARRHNVSQTTISRVRKSKTWQHVQ